MTDTGGTTVVDGANVLFNTTLTALSPDITYDPATGIFTINTAGNYFVSWWLNADGAGAEPTVAFNIEVAGGPTIPTSSLSPITSLQLNGNALLPITTAPATFALVNRSNEAVNYGVGAVQANLTIIQLAG